jgi:hypothetical protein
MSTTTRSLAVLLAALLVGSGCADKLELDRESEDAGNRTDAELADLPRDIPARSGPFQNSAGRAGSVVTVADATSETAWQQLDLDSGRETDDEHAWDLAFSRFRIRLNGGMSGPAAVEVAALADQSFTELTRAPDAGYSPEQPDSSGEEGDADSEPDNPFNAGAEDWYDYDLMTHELSPKAITYVVRSSEARFYKLRILAYYDQFGTDGMLKFEWAELELPETSAPAPDSGS